MTDPTSAPPAMTQTEAIDRLADLIDFEGNEADAKAWERLLEDVVPAPGSHSPRLTLEEMGTWAAPYQENTNG